MAVVQLRDIVSEADRAAVLALRRGPGQERYLGSMEGHFEDAVTDAHARPRMWSVHAADQVVGFAMISDGIPADVLAADDEIVGPYFLWRLLIDERFQGHGYGAATIDAIVAYLRTRPGAGRSCRPAVRPGRAPRSPSTSTTASSSPATSSGARTCSDSTSGSASRSHVSEPLRGAYVQGDGRCVSGSRSGRTSVWSAGSAPGT